jgi:hypothetical protein
MNEITNVEWIAILVFSIMIMIVVSGLIDFFNKKNKIAELKKIQENIFTPKSEYERMHWTLLKKMHFLEERAYYDENAAKQYVKLEEEAIALRNLIRKEKDMPIYWQEGDPHPIKDHYRWQTHLQKIKEKYDKKRRKTFQKMSETSVE